MEMKGDVRNSRGPHRSGVGVGSRGVGAAADLESCHGSASCSFGSFGASDIDERGFFDVSGMIDTAL